MYVTPGYNGPSLPSAPGVPVWVDVSAMCRTPLQKYAIVF